MSRELLKKRGKISTFILFLSLLTSTFLINQNKIITFQFHDGPTENTEKILKILDKYNAKVIFCVVGKNIEKYPQKLKKIIGNGHFICNHTYSHPKIEQLNKKEIIKELKLTNKVIKSIIGNKGVEIFYYPPFAQWTSKYLHSVLHFHYSKIIPYTMGLYDIETNPLHSYKDFILANIKNGIHSFILHESAIASTLNQFTTLLKEIEKLGYTINISKKYTLNSNLLRGRFIRNFKSNSVKIITNKTVSAKGKNKVFLIFNGLSPYTLDFYKTFKSIVQEKNFIATVLYAKNALLFSYQLAYLQTPNVKKLLSLSEEWTDDCSTLDKKSFNNVRYSQRVIFALTKNIASDVFLSCPNPERLDPILVTSLKTLGIKSIIYPNKFFGPFRFQNLSVGWLKDEIVKAIKDRVTFLDKDNLNKLIDDFFTHSKLKRFLQNETKRILKRFAKTIETGDIIIIGVWKDWFLTYFRDFIKRLKRKGFSFDYIK